MQQRITSRLKAALGAALLLSVAAVLPAASRNHQNIPPPAQVPKAAVQSYDFVMIDVPGACWTTAGAINDQRLATANYSHLPDCSSYDTILWQNGQFVPYPVSLYPANQIISMGAVNNRGTLFGNFGDIDIQHAGIVNTGVLTVLPDVPGKTQNYGQTISDSGQGVGVACEGNWFGSYNCQNWIWNGKNYTPLNFVPGIAVAGMYPFGINNRGQITWQVIDPDGNWHAYLQDGTQAINMDVPGAAMTFPEDINNSGNVVLQAGTWNEQGLFVVQNYIWRKGMFTALPDVPASWNSLSTYAIGINNRGDYAGWFYDTSYNQHGFIAFKQ